MAKQIYQIKISLKGLSPKIWRRVLVYSDTTLVDLHTIIQIVMGWTDTHLHLFSDGTNDYAPKHSELDDCINSEKIKLNTLLESEKQRILYQYDFGDDWNHDIVLEKIIQSAGDKQIPVCIGGKRNCPPEDCGGIWGYNDLLKTMSDPENEEYDSMKEWLGGDFDPDDFDIESINGRLKRRY